MRTIPLIAVTFVACPYQLSERVLRVRGARNMVVGEVAELAKGSALDIPCAGA